MIELSKLDLILGCDIPIEQVGRLRPITLLDLTSQGIGMNEYSKSIYMLKMSVADIMTAFGAEHEYMYLTPEEKSKITVFSLFTRSSEDISAILICLNYFFVETVLYNKILQRFDLLNENKSVGHIGESNFDDIRNAILVMNCMSDTSSEYHPSNAIADKFREKIERGRAKAKAVANKNLELHNIISSIAVEHNSYNLANIGRLTIYQLYDQFARVSSKHQIDVGNMRWAAWGKDSPDLSMWYKSQQI